MMIAPRMIQNNPLLMYILIIILRYNMQSLTGEQTNLKMRKKGVRKKSVGRSG